MNGEELIAQERERQMSQEGWTYEHDDEYTSGQLEDAGDAYFGYATGKRFGLHKIQAYWPWDDGWWKPSNDNIRNLQKAGALYKAEIDRVIRDKKIAIQSVSKIEWLNQQIKHIGKLIDTELERRGQK